VTRAPRRDFGQADRGYGDRGDRGDRGYGDRGYDRRPGGDRDGGRSFAGDRRPGGDRPRWQDDNRDAGRRDGGFRAREDDDSRGDRRPGGYRPGQDGPSRPGRPSGDRPGGTDRPARSHGFSRAMSDRIGGSFPDDRPARAPRPGGAGRPGDRRVSAPGRPSSFGDRSRPDSYRDRRDDRRTGDSGLPRIPDSITEDQLARDVREELGGLSFDRAATVGRYLVAAELATDTEQAYRYAQAAKKLAARVGVVREVSGVAAYKSGRWAEALTELQAGRRMTGRNDYLPLMADSERGLGRLDRALDLVHSAEAKRLPRASQIELRIVESGIRRDQGLADAAVLALEVPELTDGKQRPWSARLFYAYGEALIAAGRPDAAREAFSRAVVADEDEQTDALARLDELDGITVHDLEDDEDEDDLDDELEDDEYEDDEDEDEDLDDEADDLDDEDDEDDEDLDDEADDLDEDEEDEDEEDDLDEDEDDDLDDEDEEFDDEDDEDDLDDEDEDDDESGEDPDDEADDPEDRADLASKADPAAEHPATNGEPHVGE
jgi:hypothetical protein